MTTDGAQVTGTPGRYVVPDDVAWTVDDDGRVFVAPLPQGPIAILEGPAATIWRLAPEGEAPDLAARVAAEVGEPLATVRDDVATFVDELVRTRLLTFAPFESD
ncbi:PqqD family protein [Janibacter sp. G56]|uniref:PqqD family protein n=1 Tax=Janibacter sp. G56 TaxID=3418717 RepID=UPI003D054D7E